MSYEQMASPCKRPPPFLAREFQAHMGATRENIYSNSLPPVRNSLKQQKPEEVRRTYVNNDCIPMRDCW